jgi:hypothetical protein
MRCRTAFLPTFTIAFSIVLAAQGGQEFAYVVRNGEQATLSVFGPRPVDLAASKLADEFGVAVNVEDPLYIYRGDVQDTGVTRLGKRLLAPKASLLEMSVDLRPDGSPRDVRQVLQDLVDTANAQLPFLYRIDRDGDAFTLVATRTHDEQGRLISLTPVLDRRITIPFGSRHPFEHIELFDRILTAVSGVRVTTSNRVEGNLDTPGLEFGAQDEPARNVLRRLLQMLPGRSYYSMTCQPVGPWCFINVAAIRDKR